MEISLTFLLIVFEKFLHIQTYSFGILYLVVLIISKSFPRIFRLLNPLIFIVRINPCQTVIRRGHLLAVIICRYSVLAVTHKIIQYLHCLCQDLFGFLRLADGVVQKAILPVCRVVRKKGRHH